MYKFKGAVGTDKVNNVGSYTESPFTNLALEIYPSILSACVTGKSPIPSCCLVKLFVTVPELTLNPSTNIAA